MFVLEPALPGGALKTSRKGCGDFVLRVSGRAAHAGVAPDKGTAVAISYQLRRDLPEIFSTSESIRWKEASASQNLATRARIQDLAETAGPWPGGKLLDLIPPLDKK